MNNLNIIFSCCFYLFVKNCSFFIKMLNIILYFFRRQELAGGLEDPEPPVVVPEA